MKRLTFLKIIFILFTNYTVAQEINIIDKIDKAPNFTGGCELLEKYLQEHLIKTKMGANINGTALLSFKIDTLGNVKDVIIIRSLYESFIMDVIPIIMNMPKWVPGEIKGIKVETIVYLAIKYET